MSGLLAGPVVKIVVREIFEALRDRIGKHTALVSGGTPHHHATTTALLVIQREIDEIIRELS